MSAPLAEALVAAQRRSLATLEKVYVAGAIEAEPMAEAKVPVGSEIGLTHDPDDAFEAEYGTEKAAEQRRWQERPLLRVVTS